jgi:hypothetical protein
MEEILKAAREYYTTCINLCLFSFKGAFFILLGTPFLILSLYIVMNYQNLSFLVIISQVIGISIWNKAKIIYDQNLALKLQAYSDNQQSPLPLLKVNYLTHLTKPFGDSIFEAMNNVITVNELNKNNKAFSPDNVGHFISKFIYDSDAKSRILSLTIYLISLLAILLVIKPPQQIDVYALVSLITLTDIISFLAYTSAIILFLYFIIFIPLSMAFSYLFRPVMLMKSNERLLIKFFISELSQYAFSDKKILTK